MEFEKPDSPEELLAGITVALLFTAVAAAVIVGAVMWLLLDAPAWSLIAATAIIFAFMLAMAFSPMDDDEEAAEEAPRADLPKREFGLSGPRGRYGRWGQFGGFLGGIWGFNLLGYVLFEWLWTAPLWVRPAFFAFSVVLCFLMEYTTLGDDEDEELDDVVPRAVSSTHRIDSSYQRLDV